MTGYNISSVWLFGPSQRDEDIGDALWGWGLQLLQSQRVMRPLDSEVVAIPRISEAI
jgi:hypothetical protein